MPRQLSFAKGHGTENDFVILTDPDGAYDPSPEAVRFLCDRRSGVGADGLLRVVRGRHVAGWDGDPDAWFMDYRNADGSVAEMCGNGVRVFLRWLKRAGLVADEVETLDIGTRAGGRRGTYLPDGDVRVWMGRPTLGGRVEVTTDAARPARTVDVGNPHAVVLLAPADDLAALDLTRLPAVTPADAFPRGVNVEFVRVDAPGALTMRVYERGVGETRSCGTGTVAAAATAASALGIPDGRFDVTVLGGRVTVEFDGPDAYLSGPAEIAYTGTIDLP